MKDIKGLFKSFVYAFKGLGWMISHERNFRIHLAILSIMLYFLLRFDYFVLTGAEWAILIIISALVLAAEMINTAIEKTNDATVTELNPNVKIAKDVAAGAVLVFAVSSVLVGFAILWQPDAFRALYGFYTQHPLELALIVAGVALSTIFVFKFDFNKKEKQ